MRAPYPDTYDVGHLEAAVVVDHHESPLFCGRQHAAHDTAAAGIGPKLSESAHLCNERRLGLGEVVEYSFRLDTDNIRRRIPLW